MKCRHCASEVSLPFLDLGSAPPSNAYLKPEKLTEPEVWYPLRLLVCEQCWLVQTEDFAGREALFDAAYAYFSAFSTSWLGHAKAYVAQMRERFSLDANSLVIEVAANDGYLLQHVQQAGVPCLGIEPTASTAAAARALGLNMVERFFGFALATELAATGQQADLMVANNVLAHVPDINDFCAGFARLLKPRGVATFEFPHLLSMVAGCQFDTAYHEHFSYLSLTAVQRIFAANGLQVFDVQQLTTHGGSLRVFAQRSDSGCHGLSAAIEQVLALEQSAGLCTPQPYKQFQREAERIALELQAFLTSQAQCGVRVAAYGAAAKGNTLLNFAGVRPHQLSFVVDKNPAKQGKFLPGSRIPIYAPEALERERPGVILILPWNLEQEVLQELVCARAWGARFMVAVPRLRELKIQEPSHAQ